MSLHWVFTARDIWLRRTYSSKMRVDRGKIKLIVEIDRVKEGGLE